MLTTILATVRDEKIELLESLELPEGTRLLVTVLEEEENNFWQQASEGSLDKIWDNQEDDEPWHEFLQRMYGIFRDDPLERPPL